MTTTIEKFIQKAKDYVIENPRDIRLEEFKQNVIKGNHHNSTLIRILEDYAILRYNKKIVSNKTPRNKMINKIQEFLLDEIIRDEQIMTLYFNNPYISTDIKVDFIINYEVEVPLYNNEVLKFYNFKIQDNARQNLYKVIRCTYQEEEAEEIIKKYEDVNGGITL